MNTFSLHHFEQLKQAMIAVSGIKSMSPSECKGLSDAIFKKTNERVSETTLKRIYGFAYARFNPSIFTIDVMAQYCGYFNWEHFCEKQDYDLKNNNSANWEILKKNAYKITHFTLHSLKNRSGIPYSQTIKRTFINDHFQFFLQGYYTGTVFTAPSGYGKTVALCHWVDERIEYNILKNRDEIILFFSSNALISNSINSRGLNEWLLSLLGLHPNESIEALLTGNIKPNSTFFLIIDGFDSHLFRNAQYESLFGEIIEIVSLYKNVPWFKVILTMNTASYINNKFLIFNSDRPNWFSGFSLNDDSFINVPLLNVDEIRRLCYKINPDKNHIINIDIAENFNNPLFFQFYYQNHLNNFSLNDADQVTVLELIATFICNKVYQGHRSEEKVLLINGLVSTIDFKSNVFSVKRSNVYKLLKAYRHAYKQLLSMGYLRELNISNELDFHVSIQFGANNFLAYSLAKYLLFQNDHRFNSDLVDVINASFTGGEHKMPIVKWCIINSLKNEQYDCFEFITGLELKADEKAELMIFLGNIFDKKQSTLFKVDQIKKYLDPDCSKILFNYFFGLEMINSDHEKSLRALLKLNLLNDSKIMLSTVMAIIAVIKLDATKLETYLFELKSFPAEDFAALPINPLACLETIYYYLKYGIVEREAFAELTRFCFSPPKTMVNAADIGDSSCDILYVLAIYTLTICQNPSKTLRFIDRLKNSYQPCNSYPLGYHFFLRLNMVDAWLSLNKTKKALAIFNKMEADYTDQKQVYTPFMKISFHLLQIKVMLHDNKQADVADEMKILLYLSEDYGYLLIKVQALALLLSNLNSTKTTPQYYQQLYYDFMKTVRESVFRYESFVLQQALAG